MTLEQLKELAIHSVKGTAPENYSTNSVHEALNEAFRDMCKSINTFMKNRYDIYEIIITAADEYLPNKVNEVFSAFAEIQQVGQGQKSRFKRTLGKQRAKQFLTQVGLSGVYESFRLDTAQYEVSTLAIGGAVSVDFECMLDNADILGDCMDVILEGLTEAVYGQIQRALISAFKELPLTNKKASNGFIADEMVRLMRVVGAYSQGSVAIFAPDDFIADMGADAIVAGSADHYAGIYHPDDIDAIHNTGYVRIFRGAPLIRLPQSYTDETNTTSVINPQYAYIFPAGKEKVVKLVFEGNTQMWDYTNKDQSIEVNVYRKFGVGIVSTNNWAIYRNYKLNGTVATDTEATTGYNIATNLPSNWDEEYKEALLNQLNRY